MFGLLAQANMHFEKNKKCSECHPQIFKEYMTSQHANATVFKDPIHGAVYDKHPQKNKKQKYRCGKCHTPTADNLDALLKPKNGVIPDINNETQNEAVACAYCHRISDTLPGKAMNKNVISKEPKKYFGNRKGNAKSEFHEIVTGNKGFQTGKLCMGCHMHKANKKGFDVCSTEDNNMNGKNNCITCHMPKVKGSVSNVTKSKDHTFHGFPGIHGDISKLSKYVTLSLKDSKNKFSIVVDHRASHASTLHPLRMSKLVVTIKRDGKVIKMKPVNMSKTIGIKTKNGSKKTPPWLATKNIADSRIPANTKKSFNFDFVLKSGDVVTAKFGHLLMKPGAAKKFGLQDNKEVKKLRVISKETFKIK